MPASCPLIHVPHLSAVRPSRPLTHVLSPTSSHPCHLVITHFRSLASQPRSPHGFFGAMQGVWARVSSALHNFVHAPRHGAAAIHPADASPRNGDVKAAAGAGRGRSTDTTSLATPRGESPGGDPMWRAPGVAVWEPPGPKFEDAALQAVWDDAGGAVEREGWGLMRRVAHVLMTTHWDAQPQSPRWLLSSVAEAFLRGSDPGDVTHCFSDRCSLTCSLYKSWLTKYGA